jgi:alpha-tubulin suppressor-like RCC1 family protein
MKQFYTTMFIATAIMLSIRTNAQIDNINGRKNPQQIYGTADTWLSIAAGALHSFGIKSDSTLWAWGRNDFGQLGLDTITLINPNPVQIGTDHKWISNAAGYYHSLGLKSDGTLWAWGLNANGQLGDGDTINQSIPVQVGTDTKWCKITAGDYYSLGIKTDGTLWGWGDNQYYGQLGDGTTTKRLSPVQIGTDNTWISIQAGSYHTIGLKSDGTLWAWGDDTYGQLGDNDPSNLHKVNPVKIGTDTNWASIATGDYHTLALKSDGTLWTWGNNIYGQLGQGIPGQSKKIPIQLLTTADKWVDISGGIN